MAAGRHGRNRRSPTSGGSRRSRARDRPRDREGWRESRRPAAAHLIAHRGQAERAVGPVAFCPTGTGHRRAVPLRREHRAKARAGLITIHRFGHCSSVAASPGTVGLGSRAVPPHISASLCRSYERSRRGAQQAFRRRVRAARRRHGQRHPRARRSPEIGILADSLSGSDSGADGAKPRAGESGAAHPARGYEASWSTAVRGGHRRRRASTSAFQEDPLPDNELCLSRYARYGRRGDRVVSANHAGSASTGINSTILFCTRGEPDRQRTWTSS